MLILRQDNTNDFLVFINNELLQGDQLEKYLLNVKSTDSGDGDDEYIIKVVFTFIVFIIIVSALIISCET